MNLVRGLDIFNIRIVNSNEKREKESRGLECCQRGDRPQCFEIRIDPGRRLQS
jgi:hypothetical protein